ncbi:hypothetical protein KSX_59950 [Ktedonospora formicarum]|uniref:Uncharacterized protein n=1 Tax=Ktedonospora formicarum TaxID=2778364 RepID=A0A8J3MT48_9CHLR|nr:hypothetical protein KSX_59950 [Ktedonospora formicarum]
MIANGSHMAWGLQSIGYSGCFIQATMERAKARGLQYAPISNHVPAPTQCIMMVSSK